MSDNNIMVAYPSKLTTATIASFAGSSVSSVIVSGICGDIKQFNIKASIPTNKFIVKVVDKAGLTNLLTAQQTGYYADRTGWAANGSPMNVVVYNVSSCETFDFNITYSKYDPD